MGQSSELTAVGVTFQRRRYLSEGFDHANVDFKIYVVWYTKQCTFTLFPNVKNKLKCLKDQKKVQFKKNTDKFYISIRKTR